MKRVSSLAICAAMGVAWTAPAFPAPAAGAGVQATSDSGAERAASGAVMVVERICIPLVQGANLNTIAKTARLRREHGQWVYRIDRSQRIELATPDPTNPNICGATIIHDVGAQPAIRQALDSWARSQTPPLRAIKDEVQTAGPLYLRTTSTWSGMSPRGEVGVVFAGERTLRGEPVHGDLGQSELLASLTPTASSPSPLTQTTPTSR